MSAKFLYGKEDRERFFRVIADYRREHGLAQSEMAKLLDLTNSALSQYLNGGIRINTDLLLRCALATQTEPVKLSPALRGFALAPKALAA